MVIGIYEVKFDSMGMNVYLDDVCVGRIDGVCYDDCLSEDDIDELLFTDVEDDDCWFDEC